MDAIEKERLDEEADVKRKKNSDKQRATQDRIGYEMRATGPITATGHHRRHILGHKVDEGVLSLIMRSPLAAWLLASPAPLNNNGAMPAWLSRLFASASTHPHSTGKKLVMETSPDDECSYVYDTAFVSKAVKDKLDEIAAEAYGYEQEIEAQYDAGQYGPFGAHYAFFNLADEYKIRTNPETGEKAFCEIRVQELQAEMGECVNGVCPVPVYKVVLTADNLRGIHVRAADPNTDNDVKAAASQVAEVMAAVQVPVRPPEFHHS